MSRNDAKPPWRVIGISVLLFVSLALVGWLLLWPANGPPPGGAPDGGATATTATPGVPPDAGGGQPRQAGSGAAPGTAPPGDATSPQSGEAPALARSEAGTMDLQLFVTVPGIERLIAVPRTVPAPNGLDAQIRAAVQELIDWSGSETISPVPPEAGIREVWTSPGGIAYIDFDRALYDFSGGGSLGELQTVYSIVATVVVSFPEIHAVQFLIEGRVRETLAGHVDLSRPLLVSDDWVIVEPGGARLQESDGD